MVTIVDLGTITRYTDTSQVLNIQTADGIVSFRGSYDHPSGTGTQFIIHYQIDGQWQPDAIYYKIFPTSAFEFQHTFPMLSLGTHNLGGTITLQTWDQYGSVTAQIRIWNSTLTFISAPIEYTLTILASPDGIIEPSPGTYQHYEGAAITLKATPNAGYVFGYWIINGVTFTDNPHTLVMGYEDVMVEPIFTLSSDDVPPPSPPVVPAKPPWAYYFPTLYEKIHALKKKIGLA